MFRNKTLLRAICFFFAIEIIITTLSPAVTLALTSGPTAPEATSFEPVDTTDMVDIKTGDLTYNVPLIEVPGPAGGYPLSLSYHAGIQPGQEASWTGLGFSLNAGSISRLVNGYPDDHTNITNNDRVFWEGGEQTTYNVGVSLGIANAATVTAGLSFAQDTYKGFGTGTFISAQAGFKFGNVRASIDATGSISPFGGSSSSAGANIGIGLGGFEAKNLSGGYGLSLDSDKGFGLAGGISVGDASLLGASLSSGSSRPSLTVGGGLMNAFNSKSGQISINARGFQVDIPILPAVNIRLGREYVRYWTDETEPVQTFGSLYIGGVPSGFNSSFDAYDLLDSDLDIAEHTNPEKVLGGSFPDVDHYTVTAQGLGGNIKPFHFQQHLSQQDKRDAALGEKVISKSYPLSLQNEAKPVEFRFVNDFSNRYEYTPNDFTVGTSEVTFDFGTDVTTGKSGTEGLVNNHLLGSRHVKWYTNEAILGANSTVKPFEEGFINCVADGFERDNGLQIGGFSITNASGVTYHYALPVYSFDEYMKSENSSTRQAQAGLSYNTLSKPEKYAYTWYLTSVTGPDFVDRNNNHLADQGDWGYWVNFQYKKWLSDYRWRNPGQGTNRDIDGDFESYASGKKELYYLDKIVTETHVAVFEKSQRNDGREVMHAPAGGFEPTSITAKSIQENSCINQCQSTYCPSGNCDEQALSACLTQCEAAYEDVVTYAYPRSTLKLDKIKLYNSSDFFAGRTSEGHILRAVDFTYDYSLAPGTPNSYLEGAHSIKTGKLTLKSVQFLGKRNSAVIPPLSFGYKNVAYEQEKCDIWGFYKSDYDPAFRDNTNESIARLPTDVSAADVDAWSLTSIETPLGASITIDYESDSYASVGMANHQIFRTKDITDHAQDELKITFWESGIDMPGYFQIGQHVDFSFIGSYNRDDNTLLECVGGNCDLSIPPNMYTTFVFDEKVEIKAVDPANQFIIIKNAQLYNHLKFDTKVASGGYYVGDDKVFFRVHFGGNQQWPDYFPAGLISARQGERFGGGLRVKSIGVVSNSGVGRFTDYVYEGGTTSYEPLGILPPVIHPDYAQVVNPVGTRVLFKQLALKRLHKTIGLSRILPGPGVTYKSVSTKERNVTADGQVHHLPSYSRYEFETFNAGLVDVVPAPVSKHSISGTYDNVAFNNAYLNRKVIKDFSSRVGNLKSITLLKTSDNTPLSKTENHYLHDGLDGSFSSNISEYEPDLLSQFSNQGVVEETFTRARIILFDKLDKIPYPSDGGDTYFTEEHRNLLATISKLETFPSIPVGQTNINYKTGASSSSHNLTFDFYSGEATSVLTTDSYGNRILSSNVPAYTRYPGMGSKVYDIQNSNMLSQTAEEYSFLADANDEPVGLFTARVQTWNNSIALLGIHEQGKGVWRKESAYSWAGDEPLNGNGSYPLSDFQLHPFDWEASNQDGQWMKGAELTLYDHYSHALELYDVNGNFASTRMSPDNYRVISNAGNASYNETAYSGAEYYSGNLSNEGGVDRGDGNPAGGHTHTGTYSLLVGPNKKGFNYTLKYGKVNLTKKYRASVWLHAPGESETQSELNMIQLYYSVNGKEGASTFPVLNKAKAKSWYLLNIDIDPAGNNDIVIGVRNNSQRGVYFDDFRVHPLDSRLTSYVYDPFSGELNYILDENNFYTRFEYDPAGRLIRTSKELLNFDFGDGKESFRADAILQELKYNYGHEEN